MSNTVLCPICKRRVSNRQSTFIKFLGRRVCNQHVQEHKDSMNELDGEKSKERIAEIEKCVAQLLKANTSTQLSEVRETLAEAVYFFIDRNVLFRGIERTQVRDYELGLIDSAISNISQ